MPAHLRVLQGVYERASDDLRQAILSTARAAFGNAPVELGRWDQDPADALAALDRRRAYEEDVREAARPWTWDDLARRLSELAQAGLGEGWAVTSLFRSVEEDILGLSDTRAERAEEIAELERMRDEEPPGDRASMEEAIVFLREWGDVAEARNQARHEEWRRLAGFRVDMPRAAGAWADCAEEDGGG